MTQTPTQPTQFEPQRAPFESSQSQFEPRPTQFEPSAQSVPQPPPQPQPPTPPTPPAWSAGPPPGPAAGVPSGRRRLGEITIAALLAAGLASGGTYAAVRATNQASVSAAPGAANPVAPVVQAAANAPDWSATAKAVAPSVVAIAVAGAQGDGEGSGVVIDTAGHILTNNHVVAGAGTSASLSVTLNDGRKYSARIVGTDPTTDLAVLAIQGAPADLTPISVGDSDALAVGDPVMAVGNPLGLAGTVTTGIVSALDRPVTTGSSQPARGATAADPVVTNAIQTSAAINPGNSGGALVTAGGQLIGINSAIASLGDTGGQSGNIGIGFAIPSNEAMAVAGQLVATGTAQHAYLGVSTTDGTVADGSAQRSAAVIRTVAPGTPAATSGLQVGDAVVAIDGAPVQSSLSLVASIRERRVDTTVTLSVVRTGVRQDVKVTLAARPTG